MLIKRNKKRSNSDNEDSVNVYRKGKKIYFFHEINEKSSLEFTKLLAEAESEKNSKDIEIYISSNGGDVYDGLAIYDRIRQSDKQIITIGIGKIVSMAIIMILAGDYRKATENCTFMSHEHSSDAEGRITELEIEMAENKRLDVLTNKLIAEHTNQTLQKVKADFKCGDYYFDAEKALNEGYIHEVIPNKQIVKKYRRRKK